MGCISFLREPVYRLLSWSCPVGFARGGVLREPGGGNSGCAVQSRDGVELAKSTVRFQS